MRGKAELFVDIYLELSLSSDRNNTSESCWSFTPASIYCKFLPVYLAGSSGDATRYFCKPGQRKRDYCGITYSIGISNALSDLSKG